MAFFLGVDGGGTATTCLVGDEHRVLRSARSGGSNLVRLGEAVAHESLHAAVREALASAGVASGEVRSVCAGVAGASSPEVRAVVRQILVEATGVPAERVQVVGDMEVALEDACSAQPGVVVVAGTGSIAFGRNAHGETARAGGWGWAISDEGSGHWIGRRAVAAILWEHDNGRQPAFMHDVLRHWGAVALPEIVRMANALPGPDYAALFPVILAASDAGDTLAQSILEEAGYELSRLGAAVVRRLWHAGECVRIATGGGVFRHSARVRLAFLRGLRREHPRVAVSFRKTDPAKGALNMARKMVLPENARA